MAMTAYKPDQGYWTRICSAIGWGLLVAWAAAFAFEQLGAVNLPTNEAGEYTMIEPQLLAGIGAALVILAGLTVVMYLVYVRKASSEFLIATDGEMKKVNWSTRREIIGSTWVVIVIALLLAVILFVVDLAFRGFFTSIGVLR
ncbi:MAG: preprotein translocase subunit SecE [Phycisphaerales bacterium]